MKAYKLHIRDNDDADAQIVFANTAKAAKRLVHGEVWDNLENYIDLRVNRAQHFDDMENLDTAHLALEQWKQGWIWFDMDYPDPDDTPDEKFIKWYSDTFEEAYGR
ncbi:hypothetical protein ACFU44_13860 [Nocardia rhizosphaerihabitans]|uniref:hypothetical protein n=1 Tax=Nocardia rhizosphaerihabitans TaxID=1691570 RepID=UPI00366B46A3